MRGNQLWLIQFAKAMLALYQALRLCHNVEESMPTARLPNYIRRHRKRSCLTQEDVAFLLGSKSSASVSRHERFKQTPDLQTLLAYEILFRTPVRNLFSNTN